MLDFDIIVCREFRGIARLLGELGSLWLGFGLSLGIWILSFKFFYWKMLRFAFKNPKIKRYLQHPTQRIKVSLKLKAQILLYLITINLFIHKA